MRHDDDQRAARREQTRRRPERRRGIANMLQRPDECDQVEAAERLRIQRCDVADLELHPVEAGRVLAGSRDHRRRQVDPHAPRDTIRKVD